MAEPFKVCPQHGGLQHGASFCTECGQRLIDEAICVCGKAISVFDRYCGHCGIALDQGQVDRHREAFRKEILPQWTRRLRQALKRRPKGSR
jgi:predicted amidophosphoribosyltransferase